MKYVIAAGLTVTSIVLVLLTIVVRNRADWGTQVQWDEPEDGVQVDIYPTQVWLTGKSLAFKG